MAKLFRVHHLCQTEEEFWLRMNSYSAKGGEVMNTIYEKDDYQNKLTVKSRDPNIVSVKDVHYSSFWLVPHQPNAKVIVDVIVERKDGTRAVDAIFLITPHNVVT